MKLQIEKDENQRQRDRDQHHQALLAADLVLVRPGKLEAHPIGNPKLSRLDLLLNDVSGLLHDVDLCDVRLSVEEHVAG